MTRRVLTALATPFLLSLFFFVTGANTAYAATAAELEAQISARNDQISSLEADIAAYQKQLDALGTKKNTLRSAIQSLVLSQKQLAAQIQVTNNKIAAANLRISELTLSIGNKESAIAADQDAIAGALRTVAEGERSPLIVSLISAQSLDEAWQTADRAAQFNRALARDIEDLRSARLVLSENRTAVTAAKADLVTLGKNLAVQKRSVDANRAAQELLLRQTNNQEANYQKLIAEKKAAERSFEEELVRLQSQLRLVVHPGSLPKVGSGVLSWPFSLAFMRSCAGRVGLFGNAYCITQYFGTTPFSTANPQVYSGHGHDGIDIAAPIGTPVLAALGGSVLATGNTDLVRDGSGRQCYSFGKWVMIDHGDGINTMYAHLSEIDVSSGERVTTGQTIGLSGMTGYATGPHLHFGVYASEGTKIMTLRQFRGAKIGCADATMPVATLDAYLNPLSYL